MLTVAVRLPDTVGLNATEMLQFAPAGTLFPQVLVCVKSPELAPVTAMLVMESAAPPLLVRVTDWLALVLPTACPGKVGVAGLTVAVAGLDPNGCSGALGCCAWGCWVWGWVCCGACCCWAVRSDTVKHACKPIAAATSFIIVK